MSSIHAQVTRTYAEWTALSALRSGSPVKDGAAIYPALRRVAFDRLFDPNAGEIGAEEFTEWHATAVAKLMGDLPLGAGWAAKLVNVYLKTRAYIARAGRSGLLQHLHPPLDGGLWRGIEAHFGRDSPVWRLTHSRTRIKHIETYAEYETIIAGCRLAAAELGCLLIEVDQLWRGTLIGTSPAGEMPGVESVGRAVVLWDVAQTAEVLGTIVRYTAPDEWVVRLDDATGTEVDLGAGGQSRIGRWYVTRAADAGFALSDAYRQRHPHQESASFGAWLANAIAEPQGASPET